MGVKLLIVCALALVMTIPALFVDDLVDERTHRESDVVKEISSHVGGQQTFLGPTLAIPYSIPASHPPIHKHGTYLIFPAQASATVKTRAEEKRRSLFKVPVFQADLQLRSRLRSERSTRRRTARRCTRLAPRRIHRRRHRCARRTV